MRRLGLSIAVPLLLLTAPIAHAAGTEAKERATRKACLSGNYARGVEILSDLFIDTKDANHIFNQARCFEQNSRCEEAIGRFREYLRKATAITPAVRADTEKHIADCQALLGQKPAPDPAGTVAAKVEATPAAPSVAPAPPISTPSSQLASATPTPEQVAVASAPEPAANPDRGLRIAGIAAARSAWPRSEPPSTTAPRRNLELPRFGGHLTCVHAHRSPHGKEAKKVHPRVQVGKEAKEVQPRVQG